MKLIKPSVEIIPQGDGIQGMYEAIELAGRTCYKSTPKYVYSSTIKYNGTNIEAQAEPIFDGMETVKELEKRYNSGDKAVKRYNTSAKEFVDRMLKSGHGAMLEFGTVYLLLKDNSSKVISLYSKYNDNKYSRTYIPRINEYNGEVYITTNYRVIMQGSYDTWDEAQKNNYDRNWLDDLKYLCEPTEYHEKRVCVKFTTQVAITRELNRHRVNSMAEQSTRYCNFGKDKFGNQLSVNLPSFIKTPSTEISNDLLESKPKSYECVYTPEGKPNGFSQVLYELDTYYWNEIDWWLWANKCAELAYMNLIRLGWTAEQARTILPLDTNTEIMHCAFVSDWEHFFLLRNNTKAHPDMVILTKDLHDQFITKELL